MKSNGRPLNSFWEDFVFKFRPIRNKYCPLRPCLKSDPQTNSNLVEDLLYIIPTNLQSIWLSSFSGKIFFYFDQSETSIAHCGHVWNPIGKKNGIFLMSYNKTTEDAICSSFRENVLSYSLCSCCWFSKSYLPCERVFRYLWHSCTGKFWNLFSGALLLQTPFFLCILLKSIWQLNVFSLLKYYRFGEK
jgi:hypothetical protein